MLGYSFQTHFEETHILYKELVILVFYCRIKFVIETLNVAVALWSTKEQIELIF